MQCDALDLKNGLRWVESGPKVPQTYHRKTGIKRYVAWSLLIHSNCWIKWIVSYVCYKRLFSKFLFLIFKVARIKKETGVSIRIPPDNSNSDIIRIEGSPEGVSKAKVELIEMVEKMVNNHRLFWLLKIEMKFPLTTLIARCSLAYSAFLYTMYMYSNIMRTLCVPKLLS